MPFKEGIRVNFNPISYTGYNLNLGKCCGNNSFEKMLRMFWSILLTIMQ